MWTHVVLEVYDLDHIGLDDVSREEMQDRIDDGKYAWCVVKSEGILYFMSWRQIIRAKFKSHFKQWLIDRYWDLPKRCRDWFDKRGWPRELT